MNVDQLDKNKIKSYKDLKIYELSFDLSMKIYNLSKDFPREELYSLTDQIRRSSRSIPVNIREGFAKKAYKNVFIRHLNDALGSCEETRTWLEIAKECGYIDVINFEELNKKYDELSAMIYSFINRFIESTNHQFVYKTMN